MIFMDCFNSLSPTPPRRDRFDGDSNRRAEAKASRFRPD
jgi:hypothetical protein